MNLAATALIAGAVLLGAGTAHADTPPSDPPPPLTKQQAWDNMLYELGVGWNQGGAEGAATGSAVGTGIGCLSMFPGSLAGCMIGGPTGAFIGGLNGITNANPKAQQAIDTFLNTP